MINGMIAKSETFCGIPDSTVRDDSAEYFTTADAEKRISDH